MLILSKNSVNTFVAAKKMPLIRDIGFAERERETFCLLIFHLSFLILWLIDTSIITILNSICQILNRKRRVEPVLSKVCKKNDRLNWTRFKHFF